MRLFPVAVMTLALSGGAAAEPVKPPHAIRQTDRVRTERRLQIGGRLFEVGMKVRMNVRWRELSPAESGHRRTVACGPGQMGQIVHFVHRVIRGPLGAEFDLAVVRFDAQTWYEWTPALERTVKGRLYTQGEIDRMNAENGAAVRLERFELPVQPAYLDIL